MEITYDPRYNIAYIRLREKTGKVETLKISDEMNVDISDDGRVYGIELLNANEQLIKGKKILFTDESTGKAIELSISK
jgi:uncharacterized protein YuzE